MGDFVKDILNTVTGGIFGGKDKGDDGAMQAEAANAAAERERIRQMQEQQQAREDKREADAAAQEDARQRAIRARQVGRRSLLSEAGSETGVQDKLGG